jgi:SH3-like domain-containing protein
MRRLAALVAGLAVASTASALEYRSVAEAAVLYDAPSQKAQPIFVITRGTPVEVVVQLDIWVKVRDAQGDLAWIEKQMLSDQRTVMVTADRAQVRAQPYDNAPLAFEAEKDVLLDYIGAGPPGWIKVKHEDGQQGYVKVGQVWGF